MRVNVAIVSCMVAAITQLGYAAVFRSSKPRNASEKSSNHLNAPEKSNNHLKAFEKSSNHLNAPEKSSNHLNASVPAASTGVATFEGYYQSHKGRGMWKWSQYLDIYQRHVASFASEPTKILEIGVQSGGSIQMWESVLGPTCHYYGMDVNKNCVGFTDKRTTIFIGDQASAPTWQHFFKAVTPELDVLIDDGGHQAFQMKATMESAIWQISAGGFYATEDIHGQNEDYLSGYLLPAARILANVQNQRGSLKSVHIYPFVLGVHFKGKRADAVLPAPTVNANTIPEALSLLTSSPGGVIKLSNAAWPSFFAEAGLSNMFSVFYEMYGGQVHETPPHCHTSDQSSNNCVMSVKNTNQQNLIKGIHIFSDHALIELNQKPPIISATRKGDVWIPYNGP